MGSPVSPSCANLVMEYIESTVLQSCDITVPFFYRYVDDIITAVPEDSIDTFLNCFNNLDDNIKFTVEREHDMKIPFLDILIHREPNGKMLTDWYHKESWSGRYLHFNSHLPMSYKRNTVSLLTEKILYLSDQKFHSKNIDLLTTTLTNNSYPMKHIRKGIQTALNKYRNTRTSDNNNVNVLNEETKFISIPYIEHLFERTKDLLSKYNIKAVGRSHNNLGRTLFSQLKDPTAIELKSNVIYKCDCDCGVSYIGQTKQYLRSRINQHKNDGRKDRSEGQSALSHHIQTTNHEITSSNFKILDTETNFNKRRILEMIHIKKAKNIINKQTDTEYLQSTYDNII